MFSSTFNNNYNFVHPGLLMSLNSNAVYEKEISRNPGKKKIPMLNAERFLYDLSNAPGLEKIGKRKKQANVIPDWDSLPQWRQERLNKFERDMQEADQKREFEGSAKKEIERTIVHENNVLRLVPDKVKVSPPAPELIPEKKKYKSRVKPRPKAPLWKTAEFAIEKMIAGKYFDTDFIEKYMSPYLLSSVIKVYKFIFLRNLLQHKGFEFFKISELQDCWELGYDYKVEGTKLSRTSIYKTFDILKDENLILIHQFKKKSQYLIFLNTEKSRDIYSKLQSGEYTYKDIIQFNNDLFYSKERFHNLKSKAEKQEVFNQGILHQCKINLLLCKIILHYCQFNLHQCKLNSYEKIAETLTPDNFPELSTISHIIDLKTDFIINSKQHEAPKNQIVDVDINIINSQKEKIKSGKEADLLKNDSVGKKEIVPAADQLINNPTKMQKLLDIIASATYNGKPIEGLNSAVARNVIMKNPLINIEGVNTPIEEVIPHQVEVFQFRVFNPEDNLAGALMNCIKDGRKDPPAYKLFKKNSDMDEATAKYLPIIEIWCDKEDVTSWRGTKARFPGTSAINVIERQINNMGEKYSSGDGYAVNNFACNLIKTIEIISLYDCFNSPDDAYISWLHELIDVEKINRGLD